MMDLMFESNISEVLDDSSCCCIYSPLCRFCRNSKIKCYIQEKVFVGWCNFYLKLVGDEIETVAQLWDWTFFLALLNGLNLERQTLADCESGLHHNWDIVQEYLIKEKVVKSVSLNEKAVIVRKKFTHWLIEILWCLIFRHHFNLATVKMSRRPSIDYRKASHSLLKWIKRKLPGSKVNDLIFDLSDGVILCQLVNSIAPNTINECLYKRDIDAESVVCYALQAAKDVLGIPPLISAEEIVDCNADEKSLITYVALYRSADRMLARGVRPISPRLISKPGSTDDRFGSINHGYLLKNSLRKSPAKLSIAYGFGIRYGEVGKPTEFIVHLNGKNPSDLSVSIKCFPDSDHSSFGYLKAEPKIKSVGKSSYIVSYTPVRSGDYEISVLYGRKHIYNSPFNIKIKDPVVSFRFTEEPDSILSIEPTNHLSDSDYLILTEDAGTSGYSSDRDINGNLVKPVSEKPENSNGNSMRPSSDMSPEYSNDSVFFDGHEAELKPNFEGNGFALSNGSLGSSVSSTSQDILNCSATGDGLISGEVGVMSHFEVRTANKNNGPLSVLITCPAMSIPTPYVNTRIDGDQLLHDVMYLPTEPGTYEIEVKWGNKLIPGSPYQAVINETNTVSSNTRQNTLDELFESNKSNERSVIVFYSATSSDKNHQRRREYLESILRGTIDKLHINSIPVDITLSASQRTKLFAVTQTRTTPFVFVDKKFLGSYNTIVDQYRQGKLKEYVNETLGDSLTFDYDIADFIDVQIINDIKKTLNELKNPPPQLAARLSNTSSNNQR